MHQHASQNRETAGARSPWHATPLSALQNSTHCLRHCRNRVVELFFGANTSRRPHSLGGRWLRSGMPPTVCGPLGDKSVPRVMSMPVLSPLPTAMATLTSMKVVREVTTGINASPRLSTVKAGTPTVFLPGCHGDHTHTIRGCVAKVVSATPRCQLFHRVHMRQTKLHHV